MQSSWKFPCYDGGNNQTGSFHGHTKQSCWNTFPNSTNDTLDAFIHLGTLELKQDTDFPYLEPFVVVFCSNDNVPPRVKNLAQLRWYLFSKNQSESQKMPPTYGAMHEKVMRACYTTLQWKSVYIPLL